MAPTNLSFRPRQLVNMYILLKPGNYNYHTMAIIMPKKMPLNSQCRPCQRSQVSIAFMYVSKLMEFKNQHLQAWLYKGLCKKLCSFKQSLSGVSLFTKDFTDFSFFPFQCRKIIFYFFFNFSTIPSFKSLITENIFCSIFHKHKYFLGIYWQLQLSGGEAHKTGQLSLLSR